MSFLSLEKFLYGPVRESPGFLESAAAAGFFDLTGTLLSSVSRSVLAGEALTDLSQELEALRGSLAPSAPPETLAMAAQHFDILLQQFRDRLRQADEERAEDFRKALTILNQALAHLSSCNDRSDNRLKQLETSLQKATRVEDLQTLKSHLAEVLRFVRRESVEEQEQSRVAVDALSSQIRGVQAASARFRIGLKNREEASTALKSALARPGAEQHIWAALFVVDALQAVRSRHGSELADNLLEELGRSEIQALAPEGQIFCWSPGSVLLLWQSHLERENVRDIGKRVKTPFEYRAFVGSRMATFSVVARSAVIRVQGSFRELAWDLDNFDRGGARC